MTSGFACERLYPVGQNAPALHELYESELSERSSTGSRERGAPATPVALTRKRKYTSIFLLYPPPSAVPFRPNSPLAATIACRRILYARNASSVFEIHSAVAPTAAPFILHTGPLFICHGRSALVSRNARNFRACTRNLVDCVAVSSRKMSRCEIKNGRIAYLHEDIHAPSPFTFL